MLAFSAPRAQSSLVVKTAASIRPGDRLVLGRTASLILPRLYLANLFTAQDEVQLTALGITHVVQRAIPRTRRIQLTRQKCVTRTFEVSTSHSPAEYTAVRGFCISPEYAQSQTLLLHSIDVHTTSVDAPQTRVAPNSQLGNLGTVRDLGPR